ncbi:unnamed protein product [Vicia faba]|uniref:Uncharacterized protein n=1 Tax=Vicia faba TaxID=3906 RepID=A0AAV1AHV9_VICFA|nr:unnamed protein product [Vicia faba]
MDRSTKCLIFIDVSLFSVFGGERRISQHILRVLNSYVDGKQKIMFEMTSIKDKAKDFISYVHANVRLGSLRNLYYVGLKFTSSTYSCAISNILHDLEKAYTRNSLTAFSPSRDTKIMECQAARMDTEGEG